MHRDKDFQLLGAFRASEGNYNALHAYISIHPDAHGDLKRRFARTIWGPRVSACLYGRFYEQGTSTIDPKCYDPDDEDPYFLEATIEIYIFAGFTYLQHAKPYTPCIYICMCNTPPPNVSCIFGPFTWPLP